MATTDEPRLREAAGAPSPDNSTAGRDLRVDNARGVLIALIVLGHFMLVLDGWTDPVGRYVLAGLYAFHMPAFVFLAGLTSGPRWSWRRLAGIALLLVVFQTAYLAPYALMGERTPHPPLQPHGLLWLLVSLIGWQLLAPVMRRASRPLLLATALSLGAGLIPWIGRDLSLSRTLVFLPFFVAGNLYGWRMLDRLRALGPLRWLALLVIPAAAFLLVHAGMAPAWLYGATGFDALGVGAVQGLGTRAGLLLTAAAGTAALLAVMPAVDGIVARIGVVSLSIYLLHGFAVKFFSRFMDRLYPPQGWDALAIALVATVGVLMVLVLPFWDRIMRRGIRSAASLLPPEPEAPPPRR